MVFKWAWEMRLLKQPMNFGPDFRLPSQKNLRKHRREAGKRLFSREEIHAVLDQAGLQMRAMILLGINCGFGNTDCASLPVAAVELGGGWLDFPRPKTEVERLIPLWPETLSALVSCRPAGDSTHWFMLSDGRSWLGPKNYVAKRFRHLLLWAGIERGGFYWLRHTFATIAGGAKDQVAVNAIMGHVDTHMAATYREQIESERLVAVTDHVRQWLFGT